MSAIHSRAASAASRAASAPVRSHSSKSKLERYGSSRGTRTGSAVLSSAQTRRSVSAKALIQALSRPGSSKSVKSVAWSDEGDNAKEKKPKDAERGSSGLSKELEEELSREGMGKEEETTGCWQKFIGGVSSLWETSHMKVGEEKEVLVRTTLRELIVYCLFLAILCIVTLSAMTPTMYQYTKVIKGLFKAHVDVRQVDQFWNFMENDFLDALYWEEWYNEGTDPVNFKCPGYPNTVGPCPIDIADRMIMYSNRLLGVPRMRQLRVRNDSCTIPSQFEKSLKVCYGKYKSGIEDKENFGPNWRKYTSADAWRYQSVKELEGNDYWGYMATYSGAGAVQTLREQRNYTLAIIKELKEGLWIGRGTRYVAIDFTIYNANVNLFCVIKMNFEFPPSGGIVPNTKFGTVKLLRYITPLEYALMGTEFVFAVFVLYYLIEELLEIKAMRLQYFTSFWNCLDLFVIVISIATLSFNAYAFLKVTALLKSLLAEPELWADFSYLESWSKNFQDAAALTVFVGWIKIFKYISFNKNMTQLSETISRCAADVAAFSIMFFIVFLAYAQVGYLMFGTHMKEFSTLTDACFTQFRLILGDFDFPAIEKSHRTWGPIYFITYIFMVFFVLMNMFLAIINDTYSEVKEEVENRREEFQVYDYVLRGYNNMRESMVHQRNKLIDIKETVKLASDDGVVTYDEVREALRKLNFSDLEIEIFCARYDKDGDFEFNLEEINAIEQGLGEQIANYDHLTLENEKKAEVEDPLSKSQAMKMNKKQFAEVEKRVNVMETQMETVISKVDDVLRELDKVTEQSGRKASAMSRGVVRDIASASSGDDDKRKQMNELVQGELEKFEED